MRFIIAGGGTGGHLYPGIAVAEKAGIKDTLFLVSSRGIEKRVLSKTNYKYIEQDVSSFVGQSLWGKFKAALRLLRAIRLASKEMNKGDKVLLTGGFAAAPAAFAARFKKVEYYIHEQNSVMGRLNRYVAKGAKKVFLSYDETLYASTNAIMVGNPVRQELLGSTISEVNGKRLLVLGGSGGARAINKVIVEAAPALLKSGWTIFHQTGTELYNETIGFYGKNVRQEGLKIEPYIYDMKQAYSEADFVVARAGSGTVFETLYQRRPALYIPLARAADNHQLKNARSAESLGAAKVLEEKDLSATRLINLLEVMFTETYRFKQRLQAVNEKDTAAIIAAEMFGKIRR